MEEFRKLKLDEELLEILKEEEITHPTEIQEKTIPLVLQGKDVIAASFTGSGKTLAFGLGMIQSFEKGNGVQGLVMTPTRELALQVTETLKKFSKTKKLKVTAVYGGVTIDPQIKSLESADIVVGTPGRLLDHIQRKTIDLSSVKIVVLDEADMMLDMGFLDDVGRIIEECPEENRQTMLFSATMPNEIIDLSDRYLKDPVQVIAKSYVDPKMLKQVYYDIYPDNLKFSLLTHLLKKEHPGMIMVFCNTRRNVDFVVENLKNQGIESIAIHGGLTQNKRDNVMEKFHAKTVEVLVCTDVAARGLDIKGVSHVYNYDIPKEPKEYIHRAGRTARAGESGMVINLVATRDGDNFRAVLSEHDMKIDEVRMPKVDRVRIIRLDDRRGGRFGDKPGSGFRGEGREGGFRPSPGGRFGHSGARTGGYRSEHSREEGGERREGGYRSERGEYRSERREGGRSGYHNREEEAKTPPEIKRGKARQHTHIRAVYRGGSSKGGK